ncbi:MAG: DUF4251 domain-containing protein [Rikenellaceae bacterium]|nr:DUF4251 domain-containing protein [Rikenellaceae bacterium]
MKRTMLLVAVMLLAVGITAQAEAKGKSKKKNKTNTETAATARYAAAMEALQLKSFIAAFDRVYSSGRSDYLTPRSNFVTLNGDKASLQLIVDPTVLGDNGIGGFTVEGTASDFSMSTNKKGITRYKMTITGPSLTCNVEILLSPGDNTIRAEVISVLRGTRVSLSGTLAPYVATDVNRGGISE